MGGPILLLSRPVASSVIGVCLGITLSIIFTPFIEESCIDAIDQGKTEFNLGDMRKANLLSLKEIHETPAKLLRGDDVKNEARRDQHDVRVNKESRVVVEIEKKMNNVNEYKDENDVDVNGDKPLINKNKGHDKSQYKPYTGKPSRPSYAYKELGIHEKLFVAVVTSVDTLDSFGVAINKTLAQYVTKIVFFVDSTNDVKKTGMSIVTFRTRHSLLPLHIVKYIGAHVARMYDYYYIVSDRTYVRGHRLFEFVSHISVSQDLYVGVSNPYSNSGNCGLDGGIIISQRLMAETNSKVDWCLDNSLSSNPSDTLGHCVSHSTGLTCSSHLAADVYKVHYQEGMDFDSNIGTLQRNASFMESLAVSPLSDHMTVYKLQRFFCRLEINETLKEMRHIKDSIVSLSIYTPTGREGLSWPIGVPPALKPTNRFQVIQWDYFTATHLYFNTDFSNEKPLSGVDKQDIEEILRASMDKLNYDQPDRYELHRLVNGYRRFDPNRGMEYILDLEIRERGINRVKDTRINVVRPLGVVEVVPMPYVTENVIVNLVLPLRVDEQKMARSFLESYERTFLMHGGGHVTMTIVFIYDGADTGRNDDFAATTSLIADYNEKYSRSAKISVVRLHVPGAYISEIAVVDELMKGYTGAPIVSLCSVGMVLSNEYLARLRMNAIPAWQVYFPIAFFQYKPSLIFPEGQAPSTYIAIKRGQGFFDSNSYEHCSFYAGDYRAARDSLPTDARGVDLFQMFVAYGKLHVFRAVEPALKHFYRDLRCPKEMQAEEKSRCEKRRADGLASKSRLATLVLEHRQQQRDAGQK